jgi:nicotinamide mononucleotide transporter
MTVFSKINTLRPFDWFLISGVVVANLFYSFLEKDLDVTGSIAAVTGVVCVVLVARGNIFNYVFGVINVSLYAWISFKAGLYGDAALNFLYYLPMQFIGWYSWAGKRVNEESATVVTKIMSFRQRGLLLLVSVSLTVSVAWILYLFSDPQPLKDASTTVLSVIAMFLMVRRFMEQWMLWVVVNIISIVMWSIAFTKGEAHSVLMIVMWVFYLLNSINGWITWLRLSRSTP